jgi:polyisoprenoid-binding protein YceI
MSTTKWIVDPMHSEVQFKIKHLVISTVTGAFNSFEGEVETIDEAFDNASINFSLDVNSIDTNQSMRDDHLKSPEFFDAAQFPVISFKSSSFRKVKGDDFELLGYLTIRDITKEVVLNAEYGGSAKDFYGNTKYGFEVTGKINRKEFGLTYNAVTETGGIALGDEIKLTANIQLAQQN